MPAKTYKNAIRHNGVKVQLILLQKQCDDYERLLHNIGVTKDTIPSDIHKNVKQMANFVGSSGLLFTDVSFLMEWYIAKCEKRGTTEFVLNKINHNIATLKKRIDRVDTDQLKAERAFNDMKNSLTHNGKIDAMISDNKKDCELLATKKAAIGKQIAFTLDDLLLKLEQLPK